jgi:hypothetical protein
MGGGCGKKPGRQKYRTGVSFTYVCRQLGELLEVFAYLADRHELETTNKSLRTTTSDAKVHESRYRKTGIFGPRFLLRALARSPLEEALAQDFIVTLSKLNLPEVGQIFNP